MNRTSFDEQTELSARDSLYLAAGFQPIGEARVVLDEYGSTSVWSSSQLPSASWETNSIQSSYRGRETEEPSFCWREASSVELSPRGRKRSFPEGDLRLTPPPARRSVQLGSYERFDIPDTSGSSSQPHFDIPDTSSGLLNQPHFEIPDTSRLSSQPALNVHAVSSSTSDHRSRTEKRCPFLWCPSTDQRVRRHVIGRHFPQAWKHFNDSPIVVDRMLRCLSWLMRQVFGPDAAFQEAMDWINSTRQIIAGISLNPIHDKVFAEASRQIGAAPVDAFTVYPVNSPGVLLFWRCILALLLQCTQSQCEEFRRTDPAIQDLAICRDTSDVKLNPERAYDPEDDLDVGLSDEESVSGEELDEYLLVDEAGPDDEVVNQLPESSEDINLPQVFDSHFYLDLASHKIWKTDRGHTVEELLSFSFSDSVSRPPEHRVDVVGGIIVHSDPKSYPEVNFNIFGPWRVAVGVHPKLYKEYTMSNGIILQQLLGHPKVVALGDCGLDRTIPVDEWPAQDEVFVKMLRLARVDQPIVLHLRGVKGDRYGLDVTGACLLLMEEYCQPQQKVHVHCFMGRANQVRAWLQKFPNSYFGITAAVRKFDQRQLEGLRAIPRDRLLLESDAPFFPLGHTRVSTPAYLGEVAAHIAFQLDMRPSEVMGSTLNNARQLYDL